VYGYNGIQIMVKGWPRALIRYSLDHLDELKGFMPPFVGSDAEREALTDWLYAIGRPASATTAQALARRLAVPADVWAWVQGELGGGDPIGAGRMP
jgi:hypothetical protein